MVKKITKNKEPEEEIISKDEEIKVPKPEKETKVEYEQEFKDGIGVKDEDYVG